MLNDIVKQNRLKDRLEDLNMLSLSDGEPYVSGGRFDNKEDGLDLAKKRQRFRRRR